MERRESFVVWSVVIENSSEDLVMAAGDVIAAVIGEQEHQAALFRYYVAPGKQRHVAVELSWCTIRAGKHRGERAIEVRLDERRVGELTYLMSQRYAPTVERVLADGGRPGCEATVERGANGFELTLRLPRAPGGAERSLVGAPLIAPPPQSPRRVAGWVWIVAGIAAIAAAVLVAALGAHLA
jgi:hypothetical protein